MPMTPYAGADGEPEDPLAANYEGLDAETHAFLEDRASKIHQLADGVPEFPFAFPRPTVQDIVVMGAFLCRIKADLGHGKFIEWVKAECPFSYRTAHRYMRAYRVFCALTKPDTVADLPE
jgi:hypothetical protein